MCPEEHSPDARVNQQQILAPHWQDFSAVVTLALTTRARPGLPLSPPYSHDVKLELPMLQGKSRIPRARQASEKPSVCLIAA